MVEIDFAIDPMGRFGWLVPVLADGEISVSRCSGNFDTLANLSEPEIVLRHRQPDGDGCVYGEEPYSQSEIAEIGARQYSVNVAIPTIQALDQFESFTDLENFLRERNYRISNAGVGVLTHYVAHSFRFAFAEVEHTLSTGRVCMQLEYSRPVQREYDYLLPLSASSFTAASGVEILIYVLDEGRARPFRDPLNGRAAFSTVDLNYGCLRTLDGEGTNYNALFLEAVDSLPTHTFVAEFASELEEEIHWTGSDSRWLTRLRTVTNPADLALSDLALEVVGHGEVESRYEIILASREQRHRALPLLVAFVFAGFIAVLRRPKGRG
jgi:hypothetical protein